MLISRNRIRAFLAKISFKKYKEIKSPHSGQVFGYSFLITHFSAFVVSSLWVPVTAVSDTRLKYLKKKKKGFPKRQLTAGCFILFISDISCGIQMVVID